MTSTAKPRASGSSDVLDVLRGLLAAGDSTAVIALVTKLMAMHNNQLKELIEAARRRSTTKNEGVGSAQLLSLFDELSKLDEQSSAEADAKLEKVADVVKPGEMVNHPRKPPPRKRPIPAQLPRVLNNLVVPAAQRPCPVCGNERTCIGHEVTEVIDIEPARAIVRQDIREKLACNVCVGEVVCAPLGDKVIEGGAYGSRLVADLLVGKFDDSLPLYRQHERLERLGLDMPAATMGDQITWATELLAPVARALLDEVLDSETMHLDATSLPVLDKRTAKGIKLGALWGYVGVDIRVVDRVAYEERRAAYIYMPSGKKLGDKAKGELGPEDVLEARRLLGWPNVVADAAGLFNASFAKPGLLEVGCNMHGRRYFTKALDAKDVRSALPIAAFKKLYDIEERIAGKPPDVRLEVRQAESRPIYDELASWCEAYKRSEPPASLLGKAVRYLTNHKVALMRFLDDGTLPIDNGVVERLHRRPAVGRRNWLFAGSDAGAARIAIAYTVLGTCRLLGVNPIDYLADVLPRLARGISIARDLPALMPAAWAAARR